MYATIPFAIGLCKMFVAASNTSKGAASHRMASRNSGIQRLY